MRRTRHLVAHFLAAGALASCKGCDEQATPALADAATAVTDAGQRAYPLASVEPVVNANHAPTYTGPTGSVEGRILVDGDPAPVATGLDFSKCPGAEKFYGRAFREGPPLPDGTRPLADAMVAVTGYEGFVPETRPARRITVDNCMYSTRTIDLTFGQVIEVQNRGRGLYGPQIAGSPTPALMVPPPNMGDPVVLEVKAPGLTELVDRIGPPFMRADVYTIGHPLHAVSAEDGTYRIDGIPVGKVKVGVRHRAVGKDVLEDVEILAGVVQHADVTLSHKPEPLDASPPLPATQWPDGGKRILLQ